jgi:hypothetical protein
VTTLLLYALLTPAAYYLTVQAKITEWAWSRYPAWLTVFLHCSACSGFWWGVLAAVGLGRTLDLPFLGLDAQAWYTPVLVGLCSIVWTPLVANAQVTALLQLGAPPVDDQPKDEDAAA